jgi:hypothetical protein
MEVQRAQIERALVSGGDSDFKLMQSQGAAFLFG